ncbi:MAG TPA: VOC family protein, partial [Acidimicrobiales bacterium]|nr:VOC family protein [Acidimicrobiales bacterium]
MDEQVFTSAVHYRDPKAALAWLERAFGFEVTMAIDGPPEAPEMCHYEMSCAGRGRIMVGAEWAERVRSPASVGGANTQSVHVLLPGDLDGHCERARAAGAV